MRHLSFLAVLAVLATPSYAIEGELHLTWDDCDKDGTGLHDTANACITNTGSTPLHCAFVLSQPVDDVLGIEVTVDLQHSSGMLPDWWEIQGKGQCRDGQLHASGDFTQYFVCLDPWRDLGEGEALYYPGLPRGQAGQARMIGTYAIRSDSARVLAAGTMYYGLQLLIGNDRSVFPGECAGCNLPACLVLNSIKLLRGPNSVPSEILIETAGPSAANRATWVGGAGADCIAVPARASTWGRVKSLYR